MIKPEQMSLSAHEHIQKILNNERLTEEDVNAIYRLSQHLRVFGLLSATGHINQSNQQKGKIKERTVPTWKPLLAQLLHKDIGIDAKVLMDDMVKLANNSPNIYMLQWRRSLEFSQHWNFWARAYKEEKQSDE